MRTAAKSIQEKWDKLTPAQQERCREICDLYEDISKAQLQHLKKKILKGMRVCVCSPRDRKKDNYVEIISASYVEQCFKELNE